MKPSSTWRCRARRPPTRSETGHWLTSFYPISLEERDHRYRDRRGGHHRSQEGRGGHALPGRPPVGRGSGRHRHRSGRSGHLLERVPPRQLYGWTAAEALGNAWTTSSLSWNRRAGVGHAGRPARRPELVGRLLGARTAGGDAFPSMSPIRRCATPMDVLTAIIGVSVDITERRAAEEARRQLAAIVEGSGDAIFGATTDGTVTSWNGAAERSSGTRAEEIIGQPLAVLASGRELAEQAMVRDRLNCRRSVRALRDHPPPQGRQHRRGAGLQCRRPPTRRGRVVGLSVIAHDITERRAGAAALEASQLRLGRGAAACSYRQLRIDLAAEATDLVGGVLPDPRARPGRHRPASSSSSRSSIPTICPTVRDVWVDAVNDGVAFDLQCRIILADAEERCRAPPGRPRAGRRRPGPEGGRAP